MQRFVIVILLLSVTPVMAADKAQKKKNPKPPRPVLFGEMDYGPALAYTMEAKWPKGNTAYKGLAVRLDGGRAGMLYDLDTLRVVAGWVNDVKGKPNVGPKGAGYVDLSKTNLTSNKGNGLAVIKGQQLFATVPRPGWSPNGNHNDPRKWPNGPLPRDWAQFEYYAMQGNQVTLNYRVGDSRIMETPQFMRRKNLGIFFRSFLVKDVKDGMTIAICDRPGARVVDGGDSLISLVDEDTTTAVAILSESGLDASFVPVESGIRLSLKKRPKPPKRINIPPTVRLAIWTGPHDQLKEFRDELPAVSAGHLLYVETGISKKRWNSTLKTKGRPGRNSKAYAVDTIAVPFENPWQSWIRTSAFDFFEDGTTAVVATWNGDIWIVTGIDDELAELNWTRFATGLHEPLGVKIRRGMIYVSCRDAIVQLTDMNKDGEADVYRYFNSDGVCHPRAMAFDLDTDARGNFYYIKNGNRPKSEVPMQGCLFRVSSDGKKSEVYATGFRSANGMSIGPNGEITAADQQGNWVPATRIDFVKRGGFYGYRPHAHREIPEGQYEPPLCWVPHKVDNSAGSQAWVSDDRWGPLKGSIVHTSFGRGKLFLLFDQVVNGIHQGGLAEFPLNFESGIMRARFNRRDGQLYVMGLKGWQTSGVRDGAFQRVRFTGKPLTMPVSLRVRRNGIEIGFACELDRELVEDLESYSVEQWNYVYSSKYGSPEMSVKDPMKKGHDSVPVKSARLLPDGKTVFLEIPAIEPVMQMQIKLDLETTDGDVIEHTIWNTIHVTGKD